MGVVDANSLVECQLPWGESLQPSQPSRPCAHTPQDAHEFLNYLLNTMSETLEAAAKADAKAQGQQLGQQQQQQPGRPPGQGQQQPPTWVQEIFQGKLVSETRCMQVGRCVCEGGGEQQQRCRCVQRNATLLGVATHLASGLPPPLTTTPPV